MTRPFRSPACPAPQVFHCPANRGLFIAPSEVIMTEHWNAALAGAEERRRRAGVGGKKAGAKK